MLSTRVATEFPAVAPRQVLQFIGVEIIRGPSRTHDLPSDEKSDGSEPVLSQDRVNRGVIRHWPIVKGQHYGLGRQRDPLTANQRLDLGQPNRMHASRGQNGHLLCKACGCDRIWPWPCRYNVKVDHRYDVGVILQWGGGSVHAGEPYNGGQRTLRVVGNALLDP